MKPHIKLNSKEQFEKAQKLVFHYGRIEKENSTVNDTPDYSLMTAQFKSSIQIFQEEIQIRHNSRNPELRIPVHFDYIKILFQDQFQIKGFYQPWYNAFGLLGVRFSKFNHEVLFAIIDQEKFNNFIQQINLFIYCETKKDKSIEYDTKIKFIKNFWLLTTKNIIDDDIHEYSSLLNLETLDIPLEKESINQILRSLTIYLDNNNCFYHIYDDLSKIEISGASKKIISEIIDNFDIFYQVTSSLSTIVTPSSYNTVKKSYGFEISNPEDNLPIIGIIDTGVSYSTPLAPILIREEELSITGENPLVDSADDGYGHGTAVAALAALGRNIIKSNYSGKIPADARILSIKILDQNSGNISSSNVLSLLSNAIHKYPSIKIFVLTICYNKHKLTNEDYSWYAYELDKFSHLNDCIIFISTANNNDAANQTDYNFEYFKNELTNLCSPSESMNNITIGAAADNLASSVFRGISPDINFPTLYTRKCNIDQSIFSRSKQNHNLFKPDLIEAGGDYEKYGFIIGSGDIASLDLLSANPSFSYYKGIGTSFSAPLVANIAAKIQKNYPDIKSQSIKALIINSSNSNAIRIDNQYKNLKESLIGNGRIDPQKCVFSSEDSISFVIEDEITPNNINIIPINFPKYLIDSTIGKKNGILRITTTLCFSFLPVHNNHLSYCPIQMAFCFFRNQSCDEILCKEDDIKSKLKTTWSQNNRFRSSPIPASNSQKNTFLIGYNELLSEDCTFKLGIHCLINDQIVVKDHYNRAHPFSIVIRIEENLPELNTTGRLYSEMISINKVENISIIDIDAEATLTN